MDFMDEIGEGFDVRYEEIGELGDPVFMINDIDNNMQHRFYPEDLVKFMNFLKFIKEVSEYTVKTDINESYNLIYNKIGELDEPVLTLEDLDNDQRTNFYPENISKIENFLNRLKKFEVIK